MRTGDAERDVEPRDAGEDGKRRSKKHKKHHKKEKRARSSRRDASPPRTIPDEPQQHYPQDRRYCVQLTIPIHRRAAAVAALVYHTNLV